MDSDPKAYDWSNKSEVADLSCNVTFVEMGFHVAFQEIDSDAFYVCSDDRL